MFRGRSLLIDFLLKNRLNNNCNLFKCKPGSILKYSTGSRPHNEENIYVGSLTHQVRAVKVFSLSTSFAGVVGQPVIYAQAAEIGGTPLIVAACGVVGFFTFVTPVLLHLLTRKYVIHITHNEETQKYTAELITFFLFRKYITFSPEDVQIPDVPGLFTTCVIGNVPVFIEYKQFKDPEHYAKIMGYNKPMDFNLYEKSTERSEEEKSK